jgi:bud site selection protein 20
MQATSIRYYETDSALQSHWRSKVHKRRCRALKEPAYTIEESERAAGLGRDDKRGGVAVSKSDDTMSQS